MSELWKSKLTEEAIKRLQPIIQEIDRETEDAQIALRLEDQADPLSALSAIKSNFITVQVGCEPIDWRGRTSRKSL